MTDKEYLIALSTFVSIGPMRTKLLLSYFKSASKVWKATQKDLLEVGLPAKLVDKFIDHRSKFDIQKYLDNLKKESVSALTINDSDYPENLKSIDDNPYVLYVKGKLLKSDSRAVAIVGTRLMTSYGREVTQKIATELANFGITVISGLALGVDAESQRATLNAGGRTIAVLASGLDIISPLTNKALALEFIKKNGAIVSEYPLGHTPFPSDFPVRDRLISGLSKAVVVIEGRMKSGTFYTVHAAASQNRPVFAVPGPITSPASEGPNYLIQNGARPITSARDVLDELHMQLKVDTRAIEKIMPTSGVEAKIVEILEVEPLHLDELVRISGITTSEVSARLTIMEMKGLVRNMGGGIYKRI
ncbi:MAG TPA: DNA-processing protein DprA [Patescibacteria group bacterium]|nr:DNA-processing protein DprA [Patescibacteria group bacterium]